MLHGEPPQGHAAQVLQGTLFRASPEEPQWTVVAWCAVFLLKFYAGNGTHHVGQPLEMELVPDPHPDFLLTPVKRFPGIRFTS